MPLSRITSPFMSATANVYSPSANTVAIRTSNAEAVRIDSNRNVGIGTTSPSNRVSIVTESGSDGIVSVKSPTTDTAGILIDGGSTSNKGALVTFSKDATTKWRIGIDSAIGGGTSNNFNIFGSSADALLFGTNTTERMRITSGGVVQVGNNSGTGEVFAQNTVKVWGAINSGAVSFYNSFGTSSVSKVSTGIYTVNFSRTLASSRFGMAGAGYAAAQFVSGGAETTTSTRVQIYNSAGTLTDVDIQFLIAGGS